MGYVTSIYIYCGYIVVLYPTLLSFDPNFLWTSNRLHLAWICLVGDLAGRVRSLGKSPVNSPPFGRRRLELDPGM